MCNWFSVASCVVKLRNTEAQRGALTWQLPAISIYLVQEIAKWQQENVRRDLPIVGPENVWLAVELSDMWVASIGKASFSEHNIRRRTKYAVGLFILAGSGIERWADGLGGA